MWTMRIAKNTQDLILIDFEPNDGTCYQIYLTPDRFGGILIASTLGSKGLYRWFPDDGEVKIISSDGFGEYFKIRIHEWLSLMKIDGESLPQIVEGRWC